MPKKSANGAGTMRWIDSGRWEFRVVVGCGIDGKPIRKSFYAKTKTAAREKYREYLKNEDKPKIEKITTVGEWAKTWLATYKKDKVAYGTYHNYEIYVNKHIIPAIGHLKFSQVKSAHLEQFMQTRAHLSDSARHHIKVALNGIFDTAIDNGFCLSNPCRKLTLAKKTKKQPKFFSASEVSTILSFTKDVRFGEIVEILLYTGMRIGEAAALRWSDIDFEEGVIHVCRSNAKTETGKFALKSTKSDKDRYIGISQNLKALLDRLQNSGLYVLQGKDPFTPLTINQIEYRFKAALIAINRLAAENNMQVVRLLSPHKSRHTYGTFILRGGANLRQVQSLLGHSDVSTTEIYTHIETEDIKSSAAKLPY